MKEKKLNKYYILILVLILVIGIISATYAFFQIDTNNSNSNATITANVDCFNIAFEDISEEGINNLDINYPITDKYAIGQTENTDNLKPVIVKVSNKCTQIQDNLNYKLAITTLAKDTGYIPDNKVRYNVDKSFNEETKNTLSGPAYLDSLSLVEDSNVISLLKEEITNNKININEYKTVNTYIIDSNSLASNNTSTYYIKLWIDYYEGDKDAYIDPRNHIKGNEYDNSTQGQKFASVISLIADETTSLETITKVYDKSGHNYNGDLLNGAVIKEDDEGQKGLYLDGKDAYVDIDDLPDDIDWTSGFAIEFEARWLALNYWSRIIDFGNGPDSDNILIGNLENTNDLMPSLRYGNLSQPYEKIFSNIIEIGKKNKYKVVYQKNDTNYVENLYKDNAFIESVTYETTDIIRNVLRTENYIGKSEWYLIANDENFYGYIYYLKITDSNDKPILWYDFTK